MSTLLVPGTAQADATNVSLSADFDRLSTNPVATVTLKAKSASGVTDVEATVKHRHHDQETTIGSLPLALVDGTENDGTWQVEYGVDIETRPGAIMFDVVVTTADGATLTRSTGVLSCYPARFAELATTPVMTDSGEVGIEVAGRLLVRKSIGAEWVPVSQGVIVLGVIESSTQTAADGSFTLAVPSTETRVYVPRWELACPAYADAPEPEISAKDTEVSASITTPQPVAAGAEVVVKGVIRGEGENGFEPLGGVTVAAYTAYGSDAQEQVASAKSAEDGRFQFRFPARGTGPVAVQSESTPLLMSSLTRAGTLNVSGAPGFADFTVTSKPGPAGEDEDAVVAAGRLLNEGSPVQGQQVYLEASYKTPSTWRVAATGETAEDGSFSLQGLTMTDKYWRVRTAGEPSTISPEKHIEVRDSTYVADFSAEPGTDGLVKLQGSLRVGQEEGVGEQPVHFYFQPVGGSSWEHRGTATTGGDGAFAAEFTDQRDGSWTVWFWGDDTYMPSTDSIDVDARENRETEFSEFDVAPSSVVSGESVEVSGTLSWLAADGAPNSAADKPVQVYFKADAASTWSKVGETRTGADGSFEKTFTARKSGQWTAWFWGDGDYVRTSAPILRVDVAATYETTFSEFTVSPESVESGGSVTVSGTLNRFVDENDPKAAAGKPVYMYFLPAGSSEWEQVAVVQTGADGSFGKTFTAKQDGSWTVWFWGDRQHVQVNSGTKYVDVQ